MIMTHGSIANVVPGIGTALGFESGKSGSEDFQAANWAAVWDGPALAECEFSGRSHAMVTPIPRFKPICEP